ncbi:hypothetical protein BAY13_17350 [Elizabethkingia bruuniana]|uniref:hypothetical protein n=1 Tax=Elizabethkingia bruuniana TaxID=1756149 RepID=UPI00099A480E|nr:hypothetical protein [Elizabethkingia bruuniana]OPC66497.1 hypothetical protein BAY13_17350 [Elizabethkingia bruuniana]
MIKLKENNIRTYIAVSVYVALIFTMFLNGWSILSDTSASHIKYLNVFNNPPIETFPVYYSILFYIIGALQVIAALILVIALINIFFLQGSKSTALQWGILTAIFSIALFGFILRVASNHTGAANLYFYTVFLYFLLWYIEKQSPGNNTMFNRIKLFPVYFVVFYTMGFPGWQKIINAQEVMGKYVGMFSTTFLADLPGGTKPFIYLLGALEIIVPLLLIISLIKGEFLLKKAPVWLYVSLFITTCTFVMLCFGLSILSVYPGATSLVFYAILTFGLYLYISYAQKQANLQK